MELTDGVNTSARASVTTDGASGSSAGLRRSVGDGVARARAATLEGVVETDPVANLMSQGLTAVVVGDRATGEGANVDNNTIVLRSGLVRGGESSISQEAAARARLEATESSKVRTRGMRSKVSTYPTV